jgi:general stress protein YciG
MINIWKFAKADTRTPGQKARDANLARDPLHYHKIGAKGGRAGHTGGFQRGSAKTIEAGRKGGTISRRYGKVTHETT